MHPGLDISSNIPSLCLYINLSVNCIKKVGAGMLRRWRNDEDIFSQHYINIKLFKCFGQVRIILRKFPENISRGI